MAKIIRNGQNIGFDSKDATLVNYVKPDGSRTTVQAELNSISQNIADLGKWFGRDEIESKIGVNLNAVTETGFYYVGGGSTELNFPSGSNGVLLCFKIGGSLQIVRQIFFRVGTIDSTDNNVYTRQIDINDNIYGTWKKFTLT